MIGAAANANPQASCAVANRIFYGSNNQLICWDVAKHTLVVAGAVQGTITALCQGPQDSLYVGTDNGGVYKFQPTKLELVQQLDRSVTCIAAEASSPTLAVGSMDGKVYIFAQGGSRTVETFKGYALCVAMCGPLLIIGGTANQITVHHLELGLQVVLSGHENWVRSLSLKQLDPENFLLASASQERYIRLWRFSTSEKSKNDVFTTSQRLDKWSIVFEALLMGHDDWVVSVAWDPHGSENLLSSSADSSLIIWESETSGELWTPAHRLGDLSTWGASTATGTSGGFWTGIWLPEGVATVTRTGSWRVWLREDWEPTPGPTGHFRQITDVCWFNEQFLLSTSLDQTTRLWYVDAHEQNLDAALREVGRPQIHGYDMITVSPINSRLFVSAGDEKVMRVFELPRQVAHQMSELTASSAAAKYYGDADELPDVAGVPALGLSNKPESNEDAVESLPATPREDHLQRLTLWPEVEKLYGHGYEISAIGVSSQLGALVSCCKANTEQHAKLRFYNTDTWHEVDPPVPGHSLTVTSLKVSPNGKHVLSVSRDRKYMVVDVATHEVVLDVPKAHSRIIWDGCWLSNSEFATVSRDKSIKKWSISGELVGSAGFDNALTAVDYKLGVLVVGDETGAVRFVDPVKLEVQSTKQLAGRVNRLALNNPFVAVATDYMVSVSRIP